jgi:hypothetical protein
MKAIFAAALALVACQAAWARTPVCVTSPSYHRELCPAPTGTYTLRVLGAGLPGTSFSLSSTGRVSIALDVVSASAGSHAAHVEIDTPSSTRWQLTTSPFAGSTARVRSAVQVAGTPIESACMTGRWIVRAWVDDGPVVTSSFALAGLC